MQRTTGKMIKEYLGESSDVFSVIGAITTGLIAFKVALGCFRFLVTHFLSGPLGLSADLKKAGSWAVVTGCTDGIGKAYAEQLAARGLNIVLISRTASKLADVAQEVESKYKVQTRVIAADFTKEDIYDNIKAGLAGLDIGVLVNNVGMSYEHPDYFAEVDQNDLVRNMIHMNCTGVAKMTLIVLPTMLERKCGYVINIGSSAGTAPVPFLSLYSATKAYVDTLTRALHLEYSSKGITFQSVAPYFVVSKLSKFRKPTMFVPSPTTFVKNALRTVGVQSSTTGFWAHDIQDVFMPLSPQFVTTNILLNSRNLALKKKAAANKAQ